MTAMKGDIVNRVRRLPKPSKPVQALQPLFEAVSNAMHAIEDRFDNKAVDQGRVYITIKNFKTPASIEITVEDNGIGLTNERYDAFCTTDTNFKIERGGKGVGRLLWLDAFKDTKVISVYKNSDKKLKRSFKFKLDKVEQITEENIVEVDVNQNVGTTIKFEGLRGNAYSEKFPAQVAAMKRLFGSHFIAEFVMNNSPQITLTIGKDSVVFPDAVSSLVHESKGTTEITTQEFGTLSVSSFLCKPAASVNFDGNHQLHFTASGRTVATRKIDGLLGIGRIGDNGLVYHGCVSGEFLRERVNQERTSFTFDEDVLEQITKQCVEHIRSTALSNEIDEFDGNRLNAMEDFLSDYPSFRFENAEALLSKTPKNAVKAEQFAQALIVNRIRRDIDRRNEVQKVVNTLAGTAEISADFTETVKRAANEVRAEEQRQLTEYVLRRKIVLDVLDGLIRRVREKKNAEDDFHLESTLHQFICPMRVRGDDPSRVEQADHDLWVVDERLAFAKYFASDVPMSELINKEDSEERPDIFLFDKIHGLGLEDDEPLTRAILIEFKKPGRERYDERYSPNNQVARYLNKLAGGEIESFDRERVRVTADCVFYCYIIADIVGDLDVNTSTWRTTANGRGRWTDLQGRFKGSIEIIEWKDLLKDARSRNEAFINAAGFGIRTRRQR